MSVFRRHIDPLCLMLGFVQRESLSEIGNLSRQRMADNLRLKVATYNMHGLNQGSAFVEHMCEDHDIIFLQEHWLAPFDLSRLWVSTMWKLCLCLGSKQTRMNLCVPRLRIHHDPRHVL